MWTAEVEWRHAGSSHGRFCVVARDEDGGEGIAIARSSPLQWPPDTAGSVQALVEAAEALRRQLLAAGWNEAEPGSSWYSMRFTWDPARATAPRAPEAVGTTGDAARPAALASSRRGGRLPWPKETEGLWRCELKWDAGYLRGRFIVVVHAPHGTRRAEKIAESEVFWGLLAGDPDPEHPEQRSAANRLAGALDALGWNRLPGGRSWYPERFVWRGQESPPMHLSDG
jgi:hypothetical protein